MLSHPVARIAARVRPAISPSVTRAGRISRYSTPTTSGLPSKLHDQVSLLEAHPQVGMLYGNSLYWYGWTNVPADRARDRVPELGFVHDTVIDPPRLLERCLRGTVAVPCPCSVILRRSTFDRAGGFNEEFVGANASSEDLVFFAKVMLREPVLVANHVWDRYRRHPDSVYERAKADGLATAARYHYLEWLQDFIEANGLADDELRSAVRWAMARSREPVHTWWCESAASVRQSRRRSVCVVSAMPSDGTSRPREAEPLVSLIMPVWAQRPDWLRAAVDSALAQRGCRIELIVVDNGNDVPIAPLLSDINDSRLRIIRTDHGGVKRRPQRRYGRRARRLSALSRQR
jgi:hypothetical protein